MKMNVQGFGKGDEWVSPSLYALDIFAYFHTPAIILRYLNCSFASTSLLFDYNVFEG